MSCIASSCEYDRTIPVRIPRSLPGDLLQNQSGLHDLIRSNEAFLGHIEAIHYLNFPGF